MARHDCHRARHIPRHHRRQHRQCCASHHLQGSQHNIRHGAVGCDLLSADSGDSHFERGATRRHARKEAYLHQRLRHLHSGLGAVRAGARDRYIDRGARGAGFRGGDDLCPRHGDHHSGVPAERTRQSARHIGCTGIDRHSAGAFDRWLHCRPVVVAVDLLRQPTHRHLRDSSRIPVCAGGAASGGTAVRLSRSRGLPSCWACRWPRPTDSAPRS